MFKRNEGYFDRFVRAVLGLVVLPSGLFLLGGVQGSVPGLVFTVLGTWMLITSLTGFCPLYVPFGFSTLEKENELIAKGKAMAASCRSGFSSVGQMCGCVPRPIGETQDPPEKTA